MGFMGRLMLVMTLKFLALGAVMMVTAGVGVLVWALCEKALALSRAFSFAAGAVAGSLALLGLCCALTWGVGRAFAAFDPARDTPE